MRARMPDALVRRSPVGLLLILFAAGTAAGAGAASDTEAIGRAIYLDGVLASGLSCRAGAIRI